MTGNSFTNTIEAEILNCYLRATNITAPGTVYLALFTTAPTDSGGGTEVSGNAYTRQAIAFAAPTVLSSGSQVANSGVVNFPTATPSGWGTVVAIGIFDASTAGRLLAYANLSASQAVAAGQAPQFPVGSVVFGCD